MSKNEEEIEKILREIKKSKAQKESSDENIEKNTKNRYVVRKTVGITAFLVYNRA